MAVMTGRAWGVSQLFHEQRRVADVKRQHLYRGEQEITVHVIFSVIAFSAWKIV
jgi:hypothetical protein